MNSGPTVAAGSTGADVKRLQRVLAMIKLLDYTGIDGVFGTQTENAVKSFQQGNSLLVDGIAGPMTWQALPADPDTPELVNGSTGTEVSAVQQVLQNAGLYAGPIDGQFGPNTEAAVRAYQTQRGVTVDGVIGDQTWWVPAGAAGATLASLAGLTTA
ncbi:MAG: peptidoglycan-binding domain-containing protein [Vulcanimicrobiaceae bacterium]